jgi:hypothetical protein
MVNAFYCISYFVIKPRICFENKNTIALSKTNYHSTKINRISIDTYYKLLFNIFNHFIVILKLKFFIEKNIFNFLNNLVTKSRKKRRDFFPQSVCLKNSIIYKKFIGYKIKESGISFFGHCKGTGNT